MVEVVRSRNVLPETLKRVEDIKTIIAEADGPISLQNIADKLGRRHGRTFSREAVRLLIKKYGIEWSSSRRPSVRQICPSCGERKKAAANLCQKCHLQELSRTSGSAEVCPSCGEWKNHKSAECMTCYRARLRQKKLRLLTCPECGRPKDKRSPRCRKCSGRHRNTFRRTVNTGA